MRLSVFCRGGEKIAGEIEFYAAKYSSPGTSVCAEVQSQLRS